MVIRNSREKSLQEATNIRRGRVYPVAKNSLTGRLCSEFLVKLSLHNSLDLKNVV